MTVFTASTVPGYHEGMQEHNTPQRLLTRREACDRLRIGLSTYKTLVGLGRLREVAIGARGRRLPDSEIVRFAVEAAARASE